MCQRKPGPRCSHHAAQELAAARTSRDAAPDDPAAEQAFQTALREYETTPDGQQKLLRAAARLTEQGDLDTAQDVSDRYAEAVQARREQVVALRHLDAYTERMNNLEPRETNYLAQADADLIRAQREHAAALTASEQDIAAERLVSAQSEAARRRAQIRAGAGPDAEQVGWDNGADDLIARNPDGTTNAWVHREPSEGHPDGRYIPATGVIVTHGMDPDRPVNALVLEDGRTALGTEQFQWDPETGGRTIRTGPDNVLVGPAQRGARPLRHEGAPTSGYQAVVDSSPCPPQLRRNCRDCLRNRR